MVKNVKAIIKDEVVLGQLGVVLNPLGLELQVVDIGQQPADIDYSDTELIVIDPSLGDVGIAEGLIDTLKSRSATSKIPILLCSHESNDTQIVEGLNAGANDFLLIPFSTRSLLTRISRLMNR